MKPKLVFKFMGLKPSGYQLPKADLYIDCRGVKEVGAPSTWDGTSNSFLNYVRVHSSASLYAMETLIAESLNHIADRRAGEDPLAKPYVVQFFCAHGVHRSRACCTILAERFRADGYTTEVPQLT